ncbi:MAG: hypothetical protein AAF264_04010 [Pseudomonadota bacterium]
MVEHARYVAREVFWHAPIMLAKIIASAWVAATFLTWSVQVNSAGLLYVVPTSFWISDVSLEIPDHTVEEDPMVVFRRTIREAFNADFVMEVHALDDPPGREPCRNDGVATYQPNETNSYSAPWSRYSRGCVLEPGQYAVQNIITFSVGEVEKVVPVRSKPFCVAPAGEDAVTWCEDRAN